MIYFTSDLHAYHTRIIELCGRPFSSIDEMNEILIQNINKTVKESDTLYLLGDLVFGNKNRIWPYLKQIVCPNKIWILGNHDRKTFNLSQNVLDPIFSYIGKSCIIKDNGREIKLTHYPENWIKDGYIHLHGHMHSNHYKTHRFTYDIGVDANNYYPVSLDTIRDWCDDDKNISRS
jgi:calcineurin-like phosphoesterase family protein